MPPRPAAIAARDRLSGDDQGGGRRRRQGHAHRAATSRAARGAGAGAERGALVVRRRSRVPREVHRRAAPHRDPGAGRPARQHDPSGRARMLDPAAASEGDRGGAEPAARRGDPGGDGRAGGGAGAGRRLPLGRHGRVHRRCRAQLLLPRDEHPAPGRASGDRAGHRPRSGRADAAGRRRRAAGADPGRRAPSTAGRSRRGSMPRTRRAASCRRAAGCGAMSSRRARASGSTPAWSRAATSRCSTTR